MITDRQNAIGLVDRLLALDTRIHELERENNDLKVRLHTPPAAPQPAPLAASHRPPADAVIVDTLARATECLDKITHPESTAALTAAYADLVDTAPCRAAPPPDAALIILPSAATAATLATLATLHSLASHQSRFTTVIRIAGGPPRSMTGAAAPHRAAGGRAIPAARFIVLIEPGTCAAPFWLDELLDSFTHWPEAGLVGAKSYAADGALAHAGSIIRPDGDPAPRGQHDDPSRPEYCHAAQVDFISGSLALPMPLWRRLGGRAMLSDPPRSMARSLAHRVRAAGHQVWYQPFARTVLCETPAPPPPPARHILVVDLSVPQPDEDAGSQQTVLVLKSCFDAGFTPHFVPHGNWRFRSRDTGALQRQGVICAYAPHDTDFTTFMAREGARFDAILVFRAPVMEACLPAIRAHAPGAAVIFHLADLHHLRLQRLADLAADDDLRAAAALMRIREHRLIAEADVTITHSTAEQDLLAAAVPGATVMVWPLMAETVATSTPFAARRDICFLGNYTHAPNLDAAVHFITDIFPLVRARLPDIRLILAGPHPGDTLHRYASRHIIVTGKVADLQSLFDPIRIFVCPLRAGAGVKGKIISALSRGLPVISTSIGIEGSGLTDGHDVLVADHPHVFADAILRLYHDELAWRRLSANGQEFIRKNASPGLGKHVLGRALDAAFAQRSAARL